MTRRDARTSLRKEARQELCESAEDLFYVTDLLHQTDDFTAAADIAALAERVIVEANNTTRVS